MACVGALRTFGAPAPLTLVVRHNWFFSWCRHGGQKPIMLFPVHSCRIGFARFQASGASQLQLLPAAVGRWGHVPGTVAGLAVQCESAAIRAQALASMPNIAVKVAPFGRWTRRTRRAPYL